MTTKSTPVSPAVEALIDAAAALKSGDLDRAAASVANAFSAEPALRRAAPRTVQELMPLLRRKDAAGPVLRRFRQSLGLSQEKTAEICQVARHYIAHVEIGRMPMGEAPMRCLLEYVAKQGAEALEDGPAPQALLKLRRLLGMTPLAIAGKLGVKEAQVRRMETGNMTVPIAVEAAYRKLAAERGIDLDRLAA